ncbi:pyruvate phosphate dikinase, PEP/pyruvate binding domain protein [delta proteobacterium NaphS2]|nr:pyruvate phosphate dikinase, PEP/pyruvate binding domain protein [delta proteobacterium NaphS2]
MKKLWWVLIPFCALFFSGSGWAELSKKEKNELRSAYKTILVKRKGPFTINTCTCTNGKLAPVADDNMRIRPNPCRELENTGQLFCSAYRNKYAEILAKYGVYVGNIFSNEVFLWDENPEHHRVVKGFLLEKYYMDTHPESKLAMSRAYGGISGTEFEVKYAPVFFAKYYALADWKDFHNFLLQYEMQRRFFCKCNLSLVNDIRNLSLVIYRSYKPFKPVKDLVHNRLSPGLVTRIEEFRKKHPQDKKNAKNYARLIEMVRSLTYVDQNQLRSYLPDISDARIRDLVKNILQIPRNAPLRLLQNLARLVVVSRETVAAKKIKPEDAVTLINLNVSANLLILVTTNRLMELDRVWTARELLNILKDTLAGSYGAGLMSRREYETGIQIINELLNKKDLTLGDANRSLNRAGRAVEWAQASIRTAFSDVWEPWVYLFPEVQRINDDIIRSSPLMAYATIIKSLRGQLLSKLDLKHQILGKTYVEGVRALNPGLARGPLAFFHDDGRYTRENILALETTNAELEPVAGIITKDEGNVVSHVQLLARALGVPNAVFLNAVYKRLASVEGKPLFYAVTPMGRIILKEESKMDSEDRLILSEYEKNVKRTNDAEITGQSRKLAIDAQRLNLKETRVMGLEDLRRKDSGIICGPKAAFLGELKYHFPDNVARGVVIPFGIYDAHFKKAKVVLPNELKNKGIAVEGESLNEFVRRTYDTFFNKLLKDPKISSEKLSRWIRPRLAVIRYSIRQINLDPSFVKELREAMVKRGIITDAQNGQMRGVFVRSDTNVEDMPNFNGAGLNLTIFNLMTFEDVLEGVKKVWASPFTYRSFSWRQTVISDPNLVFPSIVVLESVPSEKSGVLITADVDTGNPDKMTIATAEGVGGTVDGSPAETLLYSPKETILLNQFKSPTRRMLILEGKGGSRMVPSTGAERVLTKEELHALVSAAQKIKKEFTPEKGAGGDLLPWDIEYGFVGGKLYLFQTRPFVGNSDLRNLPALAALDKAVREKERQPFSLDEKVKWQP